MASNTFYLLYHKHFPKRNAELLCKMISLEEMGEFLYIHLSIHRIFRYLPWFTLPLFEALPPYWAMGIASPFQGLSGSS